MTKIKNKLRWLLYRHPALYYFRFYLYKKPYNEALANGENYNSYNKKFDIPEIFHEVNSTIDLTKNNSQDKAIQLAKEVRTRIKGGRGLGLSSGKALKIMLDGKGGTCSDIVQAYNNFCIVNDIKIRELGIIDKIYDAKYGHAFNEYFSDELDKWIAIDVSKCIYFINPENNEKLSALELFERVDNDKQVEYVCFLDKEYAFNKNLEKSVKQIYYQKSNIPFVISNYRIKFYDRLLNIFQSWLPTFIIHSIAILMLKNVKFVLLRNN